MLAILQLDAISRPIVERMLGEGRLPTLAGLSARGEWRKLRTPATYYTGATHPTLYSGVELGEHSQYYLFQWSPEEQRIRYRRSFEAPELVWERLARAGKRTLAIDPYEGFPPRGPVRRCPLRCPVLQLPRAREAGLRPTTPAERSGGSRPQPLRGRGLRRAVAPGPAVAPPPALAGAEPAGRRGRRAPRRALVRPRLADLPHDAHRRPPVLGSVAARRGQAQRVRTRAAPLDAPGHVRRRSIANSSACCARCPKTPT